LPVSNVITQHVAGKEINEFATEMPAIDYGDPEKSIHPVNRVLQKNKSKNKTVLEILVKDAGCEFIPKHNFILDGAGRSILPGQIMEVYGLLSSGGLRCPECTEVYDWNTIFAHLQGDFQRGHKLNTEKTIKLFSQEFWNWRWFDGHFEK